MGTRISVGYLQHRSGRGSWEGDTGVRQVHNGLLGIQDHPRTILASQRFVILGRTGNLAKFGEIWSGRVGKGRKGFRAKE